MQYRWLASIALQFAALFVFWLILSGRYEVKYVVMGVISVGLVTFFTHDLFHPRAHPNKANASFTLRQAWRLLAYLLWLLAAIIKANIQVAYLVLHPRMPVEPALLQFRTQLPTGAAQVILANSITLTPGTVTVDLKDGKYVVHALVTSAAGDLLEGRMQNKIGAIFMQPEEEAPQVRFTHSLEELEP